MEPNDPAAVAAPSAFVAAGYEFTQAENVTIQRTGRLARAWGILSVAVGLVMLMGTAVLLAFTGAAERAMAATMPEQAGLLVAVGGSMGPLALVNLICGGFYIRAGGSLAEVVNTQGNDITHMLRGIDTLRFAFQIEAIALVVATVAGFVIGLATGLLRQHH